MAILQRLPIKAHREELLDIVKSYPEAKDIIVFAPSLDWERQLFQRPQQLALALAREGALVFYLEPPSIMLESGFHYQENGLYLCKVPLEVFNILESPAVYILTWNHNYLSSLKNVRVIYDYVDDLEVFCDEDPEQLRLGHEKLLKESTIVLTTAEILHRQARVTRSDVLLCPNAVDYKHFERARHRRAVSLPDDLAPIMDIGKPIVGYYGALARWFDYELMYQVACTRMDLSFVLIGPDYDGSMKKQPFVDLHNIHWLGVKPYRDLPDYLAFFDVATIPFRLNQITHSTSPLKLFEYMAGGKPVVITPMKESSRYEGVLLGEGAEQFSQKLNEALELRGDSAYLNLIDNIAKRNGWNQRAVKILQKLANASVEIA